MTTQQDVSQETSGSLESGTDVVSEDQRTLDAEQAGEQAAQPVTREEFNALSAQLLSSDNERRGLQGVVDKQAQNIRQMEERDSARSTADLLAGVPEEQRPLYEHLTNQVQELNTKLSEATNGAQQTQADSVAVQQGKVFVRNSGVNVNPDDPRINYAVMDDPTKTEYQKIATLQASVDTIVSGTPAASVAPAATQEPTVIPPGTNTVPSGPRQYASADDVKEDMLTGRISDDDGFKLLRGFGENW